MLAPNDIEELQGKNSRYAVVVGVAKRARQIAQEANEIGEDLPEKPVTMAIKEVAAGQLTASLKDEYLK